MTQPQESIELHEMIEVYRQLMAQSTENIVVLNCRIAARDKEIERLRKQIPE
jgi:hypothetical protein